MQDSLEGIWLSFLQNQHEVTIYDNLSNSTKESIIPLIEKGVYFVQGDILEYNNLVKSCVGFDLVIHLAAKSDVAESVINPGITNEGKCYWNHKHFEVLCRKQN